MTRLPRTMPKAIPRSKVAPESPALTLARHVWDNCQEATGHSWRRLNAAMHDGVSLAIRAGLRFDAADFANMFAEMRGDYWFGHEPDSRGEGLYKLAVEYANLSACQSFEAWKGRPPFIYGGSRLHCDSSLEHFGDLHRARLTSFADDGQSIILCTYKPRPEAETCSKCGREQWTAGSYENTIARRITVSINDIRAAERERVARVALENFLADMRTAGLTIEPSAATEWTKKQRDAVAKWARDRRRGEKAPPPEHLAAALKGVA